MRKWEENVVIVSGDMESYNETAKGESRWWSSNPIQISLDRLPFLEYIAFYIHAPHMAVMFVGKISGIRRDRDGYQIDIIPGSLKSIPPIPKGRYALRSRMYTTLDGLMWAEDTDQLKLYTLEEIEKMSL